MLMEIFLEVGMLLHPFLDYQQPAGLPQPSTGDILFFEDEPYEVIRREYYFNKDLKDITTRLIIKAI